MALKMRSAGLLLLCIGLFIALVQAQQYDEYEGQQMQASEDLPFDAAPMSFLEAQSYETMMSEAEADAEDMDAPAANPAANLEKNPLNVKPMPAAHKAAAKGAKKPAAKKPAKKAAKKAAKKTAKKAAPKKEESDPLPRIHRTRRDGLTPLHKIDADENQGLRAFHAIAEAGSNEKSAKKLDWYESFMKGKPDDAARLAKNKYNVPLEYRVRSIDGKGKHYYGQSDISPRPLTGRGSSAAYQLHRIVDTSFDEDLRGDIPNVHFPAPKVAPFSSFTVDEVRPLDPEVAKLTVPTLPEQLVAAGMNIKRLNLQRRLLAQLEYVNAISPAARAVFANVYERVNKERSEMATEYQSTQDWMKEQKEKAEKQLADGKKKIIDFRKQEVKLRKFIYDSRKRAEKLTRWKALDKAKEVLAERMEKKKERATLRRDLNAAIDWYNDAYTHTTNWLTYQAGHLTRHFQERQLYARRLARLARRVAAIVKQSEHLREQYQLHQQRNVLEQQIHGAPENFDLRVQWEQLGHLMDGASRGDAPTRWNWVTHPEARFPGIGDPARQVDLGDVKLSKSDAARAARLRGEEDTSRYGEQFGDREGEAVVQVSVNPKGVSVEKEHGIKKKHHKKHHKKHSKKHGKKHGKRDAAEDLERAQRDSAAAFRKAQAASRRAFNDFFMSPGANTNGDLAAPPKHDDNNKRATAPMPFDGNYGTKGFLFHHHHHLHFPNASSFLENTQYGALMTEEDGDAAPAAAATEAEAAAPVTSVNSYANRNAHHVHHYDFGHRFYAHHMSTAPGSFWHYGDGFKHAAHLHHHHYSPESYLSFHRERVAKNPVYLHEDRTETPHQGEHLIFEHNHNAINSHRYVGPEPGSYFHPGHGHFHKRLPLVHAHRHVHRLRHISPRVAHTRLVRLTHGHHAHHHHHDHHYHHNPHHTLYRASHYVQHDHPYSSHTRNSEAYHHAHRHLRPNLLVSHHIMAPAAPLRPVLPRTPYLKPVEAAAPAASF